MFTYGCYTRKVNLLIKILSWQDIHFSFPVKSAQQSDYRDSLSVFEFQIILHYSYANVSLTVNREARRAGNALAKVARRSVKISQAMIPLMP